MTTLREWPVRYERGSEPHVRLTSFCSMNWNVSGEVEIGGVWEPGLIVRENEVRTSQKNFHKKVRRNKNSLIFALTLTHHTT